MGKVRKIDWADPGVLVRYRGEVVKVARDPFYSPKSRGTVVGIYAPPGRVKIVPVEDLEPFAPRRLKTIARDINETVPNLHARVEPAFTSKRRGNALIVTHAETGVRVFEHDATETYRSNDEVEKWLADWKRGQVWTVAGWQSVDEYLADLTKGKRRG